jgi:polygalacturonase
MRLAILALFVASALAQTFDVSAFGAKGDGRTDDTAAIRAAAVCCYQVAALTVRSV